MSVKNKIYNNFDNQFNFGESNPTIDGIPTPESYYQTYVFKQLAKIQASDAAAGDQFGYSVAVSGTRIVVGARSEDTGAAQAGAAYIFDINGTQLAKIQASDKQSNDNFGNSVAVSDTRIVVGAYYEDTGGTQAGAAYIFDINGTQLAKIQASDAQAYDYFGGSVAVSDTRIVVGAYLEDTTASNAGSAYIFDIDGNQLAKIQASDAQAGVAFGWSVAVSDTRIVVGAYSEYTYGLHTGAAYIFDINGTQLAKIQASDKQSGDYFGYSVAVSNNRIVIGAYQEDTGGTQAGAAYIFDIDGNQLAKIQASDAQAYDQFGRSVAVSDTRIVVGAYQEDTGGSDAGAAYIFDIDGNQLAKIQASDADELDEFGWSVAASNTRIVVGAYLDDSTAYGAGSAYIFENDLVYKSDYSNNINNINFNKLKYRFTGKL